MEILIGFISDINEKEYNEAFDMMSAERKIAVLRYKSENDRKRSVLGEKLARKGISSLLKINEREIEFSRTEKGKPFCTNADVHFSISHSKDIVVCALDSKPIGVDAELIRDIELRVTKIACTESDLGFIFETDDENERKLRFFEVWTAKEAYFKFLGTGIEGLKTVSYEEIKPYCQQKREGDYLITVYQKQ